MIVSLGKKKQKCFLYSLEEPEPTTGAKSSIHISSQSGKLLSRSCFFSVKFFRLGRIVI